MAQQVEDPAWPPLYLGVIAVTWVGFLALKSLYAVAAAKKKKKKNQKNSDGMYWGFLG